MSPSRTLDRVTEIRPEERDWMAIRHVADLPHGLFPRLGVGFVRHWHRAHLDSPYGLALVARAGGVPVGFALCSLDRRAHVEWLLAHRRRELALPALGALLLRPGTALEFVRTRARRYARRLLRRPVAAAPGRVAPVAVVAVLDAIVVVEEARGQGIGTDLVEAFMRQAVAAGIGRAELVTKAGAVGAAGFYERRGWSPVGSHADRDGDEVVTFRINLDAAARSVRPAAPSGRRVLDRADVQAARRVGRRLAPA